MASSSSLYTNYHRKLLNYANESSNTTVQTCLNFCTTEKNDTVSSSPAGFCPPACLAICPSICHYSLFPPNNNSLSPVQPNTPHNLSPLLITMLIVLASAFLLITFYIIYTKFYHHYYHNSTNSSHTQTRHNRRNNRARVGNDFLDEEQGSTMVFHPIWYIPTVGLNPTVISSISIHKYEKGKMLNEKDCAVCLAEFEEKEELKILPKCNHAFHVMCIDTWLKSHVTCPLCRAHVVPPSDHQLINRDQPGSDSTTTTVVGVEEEVLGRDEDYEVENDLESGLEDKKEQEGNNGKESISSSSNSQRWSLERGAVNLVSRPLSCSAKIFSSRYNNRPSPNS